MRAPRYQFPESVREATRSMASRMVRSDTVARSPDELDAWIAGAPDIGATLTKGGYGTAFDSADLLPLLQVLIVKAGGAPPASDVSTPPTRNRRSAGVAVALAVVVALVLIALATGAFR
jgi:hypothetical protein